MPSIGLVLSEPSVTYSRDDFAVDGWRWVFKAELGNRLHQHVDLTTPEGSLDKVAGYVAFETSDNGRPPEDARSGCYINYWEGSDDVIFPHPPSYTVVLRVTEDELGRLMKTVSDGFPLRGINVQVPDMKLGWEPDGSGKIWDNAKDRNLAIKGFRMFFGSEPADENLKQIEPDPPEAAIETDLKSLVAIRDLHKTAQYILYALIVIAVLLLLKH